MGSGLERASTLGPRYVCMDLGILLLRSVLSCLVVWHLQMAVPMIHTAAGSMPSSLFTLSACVFLHTGPILVHRQVPRSRTVGTSRLEHCPLQPGLRQFRDAGARAEALASSFLAPSDGGLKVEIVPNPAAVHFDYLHQLTPASHNPRRSPRGGLEHASSSRSPAVQNMT